jgi:purine-nucleoside phosphorylase
MDEFYSLEQYDRIADFIRSKSSYHPKVGIILGSGLGALAASVEFATIIPIMISPIGRFQQSLVIKGTW